jgi:hypothetical protein
MARFFRIHPAIGMARLGNSPSHFVGPETPGLPANSNDGVNFKSFRDEHGQILRQGARFRIFEYTKNANGVLSNPVEVAIGNDVADIEWRVHIANRKASFYSFYGQFGADDTYVIRRSILPSKLIKFDGDDPQITNLRNATVAAENRVAQLEIDPGEQVISTSKPDNIELDNPNKNIPIRSLGTLRLDENGRLIVLGGYGESNFRPNGDAKPDLKEYANNDNWFDDTGDGSVKARIKLVSGETIDADPAWVMVGPPDFAPATGNVVTLFDTIWDVAVRNLDVPPAVNTAMWDRFLEQKSIWKSNGGVSLKGYKPSFTNEIYPLLKNALGARDVHKSGIDENPYHTRMLRDYATMCADSQAGIGLRKGIFKWIRDPDNKTIDWENMPRGLGDNYTELYKNIDYLNEPASEPTCFLSLTRIQYALLREWANGQFVNDWLGNEPVFKPNPNPTPDDLDQAAAQNSVGGPFYPGIDVSWLIRTKELYAEPFRFVISSIPESEAPLKGVQVGALIFCTGFFSQQMALPWQADFYDCHKESWEDPDSNPYFFMWWTAHRPDDVFPSGGKEQVRWVREFDKQAQTPDDPDNDDNLERFHQMQSRWHELKFICVKNVDHYEEEP